MHKISSSNAPSSNLNPMFHVHEELSKERGHSQKMCITLGIYPKKFYMILGLNTKAHSLISSHFTKPLTSLNFPPLPFY